MNLSAVTMIEPEERVVLRSPVCSTSRRSARRRRRSRTRNIIGLANVSFLSDVEFIDSTGLRLIVSATLGPTRRPLLELVKGPNRLHRVFRMTLMNDRLAFIDRAPGDPTLPSEPTRFRRVLRG